MGRYEVTQAQYQAIIMGKNHQFIHRHLVKINYALSRILVETRNFASLQISRLYKFRVSTNFASLQISRLYKFRVSKNFASGTFFFTRGLIYKLQSKYYLDRYLIPVIYQLTFLQLLLVWELAFLVKS